MIANMLQAADLPVLMVAGFIGMLAGICVAAIVYSLRSKKMHAGYNAQLAKQEAEQQQSRQIQTTKEQELHATILALTERAALLPEISKHRDELQQNLSHLQHAHNKLKINFETQQASFHQQQQAQQEKLALMESTERRLSSQFENLANRIFEQKTESFSKLNKSGMDALLTPLKEQLEAFKRQMNEQHVREGQDRASLKTEILNLKQLNQRITEEAAALTLALKGDNKQQGNWGEVILNRILTESGLREGHEFETQVSMRSDDGKQQQPDVIVHLPNEKDVVIDSKVSLLAYEKYFNSDCENARNTLLREHVSSLKAHVKALGKKDYQSLPSIRTLDYVLMFVPVEPAFLLAIDEAPELVSYALNQNIMLVSPTNLLVALRTINNIWQYEYQNQNAQKIAQHAAKLYDKFNGFIADMEKLGKALDTSQKCFDGALNKLSQGRGNIVRQIEQFRDFGVQPSKRIPSALINDDESE